MGNWDQKMYKEWIIKNKSFLCGHCNTLVSLMAGTDYFYFGDGFDKRYKPNLIFKRDGLYVTTLSKDTRRIATIEEYFAKDYVVWKCEKCHNININQVMNEDPSPIIPMSSEYFEINEISKISKTENQLVELIDEFYKAKTLRFNSSATLLGRKILMHICVEQKIAFENSNFIEYVNALKKSDLIGSKWKQKIDELRKLGNDEAHKIKIASDEELDLIASIIKNLLTNIYVD